jgi:NDP-sugar pyrophosphorylase family protein
MQCVILAGGLGTRMRPLTTRVPKALLPVGDTPFAHYQLSWLARHGVTEVVYSIAVLGEMIRDFVGDGGRWGLSVRYVEDGKELLGTAGALRRVYDAGLLHDPFLVLYGDSFLPFDFRQLTREFERQKRPAMMAVYRNQNRYDAGNVQYADGIVHLYRKGGRGLTSPDMLYIDYGVSVLRQAVVSEHVSEGGTKDLADIYHRLSMDNQLAGWEVGERFYEVGSPAGLRDFEGWITEHPVHAWASLSSCSTATAS